jgi:hypothetical protein
MTVPGLVMLAVLTAVAERLVRSHRRTESRARLLEVLARATRRAVPLPPLLERAADEARGDDREPMRVLATRLGSG